MKLAVYRKDQCWNLIFLSSVTQILSSEFRNILVTPNRSQVEKLSPDSLPGVICPLLQSSSFFLSRSQFIVVRTGVQVASARCMQINTKVGDYNLNVFVSFQIENRKKKQPKFPHLHHQHEETSVHYRHFFYTSSLTKQDSFWILIGCLRTEAKERYLMFPVPLGCIQEWFQSMGQSLLRIRLTKQMRLFFLSISASSTRTSFSPVTL